MSYYLQIDQDEPVQIASLKGYGDMIRWVKSVPQGRAPALRHLVRYGWEDDVKSIISQLDAALKAQPPIGSTLQSVQGFLKALKSRADAKVVTITDGLGPDRDGESGDV